MVKQLIKTHHNYSGWREKISNTSLSGFRSELFFKGKHSWGNNIFFGHQTLSHDGLGNVFLPGTSFYDASGQEKCTGGSLRSKKSWRTIIFRVGGSVTLFFSPWESRCDPSWKFVPEILRWNFLFPKSCVEILVANFTPKKSKSKILFPQNDSWTPPGCFCAAHVLPGV